MCGIQSSDDDVFVVLFDGGGGFGFVGCGSVDMVKLKHLLFF